MLCNEFVFNILSSLVGEILDFLLVIRMLLEVVIELTDDLLHEVLSVHSLSVLIHDIHRVCWGE